MKNRWIDFRIGFYKHRNDYKIPYGTMMISINCGIVHISFDIKPNNIRDFVAGVFTGREFRFQGRCDINAGELNKQINKFQESTLVGPTPDWLVEHFERSNKLRKALHDFETSHGNNQKIANKLINDLKEIYKIT